MQDSEKQRPQQRSARNNGQAKYEPTDSLSQAQTDDQKLRPQDTGPSSSALPSKGLLYALITGVLAGILAVLLNVVTTLVNSSAFQKAALEGSQIAYNTALMLVGLQCLNFFVSLLICFFAGFIVGKLAVRRRLGFYAGALIGVIVYIGSFVTHYIPNYPGNISTNSSINAGAFTSGIVTSLIFLLIWGLIGGLASVWGTQLATRKHPYYQMQEE